MYMTKDTVDGYLGIMELDLTNVPENLRKQTAEQHTKDIDDYKIEQLKLKPHLRYENTVVRIEKMHQYAHMQQKKQTEQKLQEQIARNERYNKRVLKHT